MSAIWRSASLIAALLLLLGPAGAAGRGHYVIGAANETRVHLRGSDGYRILIAQGFTGSLFLQTRKGGAVTQYAVAAPGPSGYGVRGRLPGLGAVSLSFHPSGRVRRLAPYSGCEGPGLLVRHGVVTGRIRFVGENGYTRVGASHARAEVLSVERQRCEFSPPPGGWRPPRRPLLFEAFSERGQSAGFTARRFPATERPRSRRVEFRASVGARRGRLRILRTVTVSGPPPSLRQPEFELEPERLIVEPPFPFRGSATYGRTPESTFTWCGSLAAEFPGIGEVALAGPRFETRLCIHNECMRQSLEDDDGIFFGLWRGGLTGQNDRASQ